MGLDSMPKFTENDGQNPERFSDCWLLDQVYIAVVNRKRFKIMKIKKIDDIDHVVLETGDRSFKMTKPKGQFINDLKTMVKWRVAEE